MSAPIRPLRVSARAATAVAFRGCGQCLVTYYSSEWPDLELVEVLDSSCVRQLLSDWPPGISIEVRRCKRCGGEIARPANPGEI